MIKLMVPEKWDHETDVLIIGGGTAGIPAGIAVIEAGSKATLLELTSSCGGSGRMIGVGAAFAGTDFQKKTGIEDSPDVLVRDGVEVAGGSPELWRVYADNQIETFNWLESIGCPPESDFCVPGGGHRIRRIHRYVGSKVMSAIYKQAKEKGVEILFKHRATRLIWSENKGRVLGAKVSLKDKDMINICAKKAIILATGGFGRNRDMLREYGQRFVDCPPMMHVGHKGDGLKMGLDMGAATSDIGQAVVASFPICTTKKKNAIFMTGVGVVAVNVHGKRFCDESCPSGDYGELTDAGLDQPDRLFWLVYDNKIRAKAQKVTEVERFHEYNGDTFDELARNAGIDPAGFVKTMEQYDKDLKSNGFDTVFGRKTMIHPHGKPRILETPPYYAIKCTTTISSMKGGLRINPECRVVNNYGEIIPGLYAAGEVTGGLFGKGVYLGAVLWPASLTFGRLAGRNAASELPWG
jgi:fumarate reductase flavoprotein subunit